MIRTDFEARIEQDAAGVITDWNAGGRTAVRVDARRGDRAAVEHAHPAAQSRAARSAACGRCSPPATEPPLAQGHGHPSRRPRVARRVRAVHADVSGVRRIVAIAQEIGVGQQMPTGLSLGPVRFDAILDQIEDACAVVDRAGNYRFVNNAFCRLFDRSRETLLGTNFKGNSGTDERIGTLREVYSKVWKTGIADQSVRVPNDDQRRREVARAVGVARSRRRRPADRVLDDHPRLHRAGDRAAGAGEGQGGGGKRQQGEERVPGEHEPRDPDADERHHRHDGAGARHRADAVPGRLPRRPSRRRPSRC